MSGTPNPTDQFPTVEPGGKIVAAVQEWFVMIPPGDAGKSDTVKRQHNFRVQYKAGSQAWKDASAGRVVQGAEGDTGNPQLSLPLVKWKGPFATEDEAKAAQAPLKQPVSLNPLPAIADATGLSAVGAFLAKLGQASTWLRVAEVALGLVLVAVGVAKLVPAFTPAQMIAKRAGVKL